MLSSELSFIVLYSVPVLKPVTQDSKILILYWIDKIIIDPVDVRRS